MHKVKIRGLWSGVKNDIASLGEGMGQTAASAAHRITPIVLALGSDEGVEDWGDQEGTKEGTRQSSAHERITCSFQKASSCFGGFANGPKSFAV